MRASCLTFDRRRSLRERRPRGSATGARPPVLLKTLGCRSQGDRRSRKPRGAVCGVAAPPRCTEASPSSRLLASDPAALATPPHTLFQKPATRSAGGCERRRNQGISRKELDMRKTRIGLRWVVLTLAIASFFC